MQEKQVNHFKVDVYPHYQWLLQNSPRLDSKTAHKIMEWSLENDITTLMLWKIPNKEYQRWYRGVKKEFPEWKTTLEEETTYIVSSNNKAFGCFGGYSIFANSIGAHLRNATTYSIDRIEHYECEFAIIIYMKANQI